jgi:hypothetical protein
MTSPLEFSTPHADVWCAMRARLLRLLLIVCVVLVGSSMVLPHDAFTMIKELADASDDGNGEGEQDVEGVTARPRGMVHENAHHKPRPRELATVSPEQRLPSRLAKHRARIARRPAVPASALPLLN